MFYCNFIEFLEPSVVELYLKFNPSFLDEFVRVNVQQVQIAKWLDMKADESQCLNSSVNKSCKFFWSMIFVLSENNLVLFTWQSRESEYKSCFYLKNLHLLPLLLVFLCTPLTTSNLKNYCSS